tara:strand:+ start:20205 stop:20525 length:321 start_codon:yes stop_codon:yes gene_type:complete
MIIFYDPAQENQVMAVYTDDTKSTVWGDRGYVRAEVPEDLEDLVSRDTLAVLTDGDVTGFTPRANLEQPTGTETQQEKRLRELRAKGRAGWTSEDRDEILDLLLTP